MKTTKNLLVLRAAFAVFALAVPSLLIAPGASASTISECQALIASLRTETESVAITGRNAEKNRTGMLGKLDNASTALDRVKLCDAIRKLDDFRVKVNQLIAAGNINTDPAAGVTGQDLLDGANEAIACIQTLVEQSGVTCPPLE